MTGAEFRAALAALGWSYGQVAELLGAHKGTVQGWANGSPAVPRPIGRWLIGLVRAVRAHPPPVGWRVSRAYGASVSGDELVVAGGDLAEGAEHDNADAGSSVSVVSEGDSVAPV